MPDEKESPIPGAEQKPKAKTETTATAEQQPAKPEKKEGQAPTHAFDLKVGDVVIERNGKKAKVTKQNFETVYKAAGWVVIDEMTHASQKKS